MGLLDQETTKRVKDMLADVPAAVKLVVFTDDEHCEYCTEIVQLVTEVAATSDLVSVETYEIHRDADKALTCASTGHRPWRSWASVIWAAVLRDTVGVRVLTLLHGNHCSHGHAHLDPQTKEPRRVEGTGRQTGVLYPTCPYSPKAANARVRDGRTQRLVKPVSSSRRSSQIRQPVQRHGCPPNRHQRQGAC